MQTTTTQTNGTPTTTRAAQKAPAEAGYVVTPPVDVYEGSDELLVLVDLPGVKAEGLTVDVEREVITLRATREPRGRERTVTFKRTFSVPREVALEKVSAKLENGVLALALPKRAEDKPRQIKIAAG